ncbi:MAG: hypothetical protein ACTHZX_04915 [Microbacterium sp.]
MSTEAGGRELPKTVVPSGITDPVTLARAELKAALAAIEHKSNFPARAAEATSRKVEEAKRFAAERPAIAMSAAASVAVALGTAVWGIARILSSR